jgi:hypothetical protein
MRDWHAECGLRKQVAGGKLPVVTFMRLMQLKILAGAALLAVAYR